VVAITKAKEPIIITTEVVDEDINTRTKPHLRTIFKINQIKRTKLSRTIQTTTPTRPVERKVIIEMTLGTSNSKILITMQLTDLPVVR
jgi:hypothetical protein